MEILAPVLHCLYYCDFIIHFDSEWYKSPTFMLFKKCVLAILVPLHFNINFEINLSIYQKGCWNFDRSVEFINQFVIYLLLSFLF